MDGNKHLSLRRIHSPNICTSHSFYSVFSDLHKMPHHFIKLFKTRQWENDGWAIGASNLHFEADYQSLTNKKCMTIKSRERKKNDNTSEILKKWPLLLLPRSKKNLFWSTLITLEAPTLPLISSWAGSSVDRSTVISDEGAVWVLWPAIKPAPTSSESPTIRSEASEFCC